MAGTGTMTVAFPHFENESLQAFSACGRVATTPEVDQSRRPKKIGPLIAKISDGRDPIFVRCIVNQQSNPEGLHVHVDMARESTFKVPPKPKADLREISEELERACSGNALFVRGRATFKVRSNDLPPDGIVSLVPESSNVRLTGATFQMTKGPLTEVSWTLVQSRNTEPEEVSVDVECETQREFSPDYLQKTIDQLTGGFKAFVIEGLVTGTGS